MRPTLLILLLAVAAVGCSRKTYRLWADRDARCLIDSRQTCPEWQIPCRDVEAPPTSRMHDFNHPDWPCDRPCDDPAAAKYMNCSYCYRGSKYWDQFCEGAPIEQLHWSEYLPLNEDGECEVDRQTAVDLALLHNRQYQTTYEQLYLNALALSLNRYDFHSRWFGGNGTSFNATGDGPFASRLLTNSTDFGFGRNFIGGGQLLTSLANSFVWQLGAGPNTQTVTTNLLFLLTQPLLRGAFRHIRMENLTQSERSLLYGVRDFVRFRRQFYLDTVSQYLGLLTTVQSLKNQRENLKALELNLRETRELLARDQASPLQVDQVFQQYQSGRLSVLAAEQSLQDSLDAFKFALGLPPGAPITINDSILDPFQLSDPRLDQLRDDVDMVYDQLRQFIPPEVVPVDLIASSFEEIVPLIERAQDLLPEIVDELEQWKEKLKRESEGDNLDGDTRLDQQQQQSFISRITTTLEELEQELADDLELAEQYAEEMEAQDATDNWQRLQSLIGGRVQGRIATLFVAQNQIRLFLIELRPFDIDIDFAVETAICNRLDLKNQRAIVTDAFRQVEIAADQLQSDFNVSASANLATDPNQNNPLRFDSSAASYSLSAQFDGPLDRFAERNLYRASQIAYQNSRRNFMELEDGIRNSLRSAVRQLKINRLNFQITRQQLISVTRRVDEAQINLRLPVEGLTTSRTRDLLEALQDLLATRNNLIGNWIDYEVSRITLFVEMEMLFLDDCGVWINERYNPRQDRTDDGSSAESQDRFEPDTADLEQVEPADDDADGDQSGGNQRQPDSGTAPEVRLDYFEGLPERPRPEGN